MTVLDAIIRDDSDRIAVLYFSGAPQKLMHLMFSSRNGWDCWLTRRFLEIWMPTLFMVAYKTMELQKK